MQAEHYHTPVRHLHYTSSNAIIMQVNIAETGGRMRIADKTVLVTGANRGIGQALVEEALKRGAKRVYAGTRQPLAHLDGSVTPVTLDVTNAGQTQGAVERVESLDILINNAGLALTDDLSDRAALDSSLSLRSVGHVQGQGRDASIQVG